MKLCILATSVLTLLSGTSGLSRMAYAQDVSGPGYWQITDTDEDGIPDGLERQLIDRYRPIYRYDAQESFWPSSVTWHASQSEMTHLHQIDQPPGVPRVYVTAVLYSHAEMAADPENLLRAHLKPPDPDPHTPSTLELWPDFVEYGANVYNASRQGQWFVEGGDVSSMGVYAWCQVVYAPPNYDGTGNLDFGGQALPYVMIQYWQFFSHNDAPNFGDHEGDWLFLDVFVKPFGDPQDVNAYDLIGLVYHHHGDGNCEPSTHWGNELPADDIPVCFLEEDVHEWHHGSGFGLCGTLADCDGDGVTYRVNNVINLGQKFAIMDEPSDIAATRLERRMALFFNGRWGDYNDGFATNPAGPAVDVRSQYTGAWAIPERPLRVVYVDPFGNVDPINYSIGTRNYPYHNLNNALSIPAFPIFSGVRDYGRVRVAPGVYALPPDTGQTFRRLNRPMRIEALGTGEVRIGVQ